MIPHTQKITLDGMIDSKLDTAISMSKGDNHPEGSACFNKSVFESKAIQDIGTVSDAKECWQWNKT